MDRGRGVKERQTWVKKEGEQQEGREGDDGEKREAED